MEVTTERVERLLALLVLQQLKGSTQREKVLALNRAGFSNVEIADLLETTAPAVSQYLYESRKVRRPRKVREKTKNR